MDRTPKRAPTNTAAAENRTPEDVGMALFGGSGRAIEAQEARGQREFVGSDTLPAKGSVGDDGEARRVLEAAGVRYGDPVPSDPLFVYVDLPPGWRKDSTGHSMWSTLLDDRGRERAKMFYKAAFYDRDAFLGVTRRFNVGLDYERLDREKVVVVRVTDAGTVVHETSPRPEPSGADAWAERRAVRDAAEAEAEAWLDERHPDWRNPAAYW